MVAVKYIEIEDLMGHKVVAENSGVFRTWPQRVNIITGCNGSLKTTFLEALAASLSMITRRNFDVYEENVLQSYLRGDWLSLYELTKAGFKMKVNDYYVKTVDVTELREMGIKNVDAESAGIALYKDRPIGVLLTSHFGVSHWFWNTDGEKFTHIPIYLPDIMTFDFVKMFTSSVDFTKSQKLVKEVLDFEGVYAKIDEHGRFTLFVINEGKEVPIHRLGRGMMNMVILALASSNDVVIVDNIENSLDAEAMSDVIEIMSESGSQWFVTTYSSDFLRHVLLENPSDVMVYRFEKKGDVLEIRQIDGEQARKVVMEGSEDLRGSCYEP